MQKKLEINILDALDRIELTDKEKVKIAQLMIIQVALKNNDDELMKSIRVFKKYL